MFFLKFIFIVNQWDSGSVILSSVFSPQEINGEKLLTLTKEQCFDLTGMKAGPSIKIAHLITCLNKIVQNPNRFKSALKKPLLWFQNRDILYSLYRSAFQSFHVQRFLDSYLLFFTLSLLFTHEYWRCVFSKIKHFV